MEQSNTSKDPDPTLDSIIWQSYKDPGFFNSLVTNQGDTSMLKSLIKSKLGVKDVSDETINRLLASLRRPRVQMSPIELMHMLQEFTSPKMSLAKGTWCEW